MASNIFLYWGSGSIPCWKAMIVLEEKGLSGYPNKKISFSDKEHKGADVTKLNPRGQVPAFRDGNVVVNESSAICFYLEEKFANQGTRLLPVDLAKKANVLQRVYEAANFDVKLIAGIVHYLRMTPKDKIDQSYLESKYEDLRQELARWEGFLKASGTYVNGADFTMADIFFFPFIAFAERLGLKLDKFPKHKILL